MKPSINVSVSSVSVGLILHTREQSARCFACKMFSTDTCPYGVLLFWFAFAHVHMYTYIHMCVITSISSSFRVVGIGL